MLSVTRPVLRTALGVVLAGGLLLAGCSGNSATQQTTASESTGSDIASSSTGATGGTLPAPATGSAGTSGAGMSGAGSSGAGSSSAGSSGAGSSSPAMTVEPNLSSTTSVVMSSRSPKPTPSSPSPSGTGVVGAFNPTTVTFFTALCTGLGGDKPRDKFKSLTGDLDSKKAAAAALLTGVAGRLDAAVATMKTAGAPSVEDGSKLAAAVVSTFGKLSADARTGAASLGAATDEANLQQLFDKTLDTMNTESAGLDAFNEMMGAPAMEVQLGKIPSCATLINA